MGDQREDLDNLRDYYLQRGRQLGVIRRASWFTDKMPLNETHLGLIGLLFPEAPILHVLRHPLDVVLSVFSNHLTHGFYCAYALEDRPALCADFGSGRALPARDEARYLRVRYEDIVETRKASMRRDLDFVGAPFDKLPGFPREPPLCAHRELRPGDGEALRPLALPLSPLSEHLAPVIPILEPAILQLGYTIDG